MPLPLAAGIFGTGDGVDTLWNVEVLRFCVANDAVTKLCTRTLNRLVSDFGAAPIAASQGLSALAQTLPDGGRHPVDRADHHGDQHRHRCPSSCRAWHCRARMPISSSSWATPATWQSHPV